MSKTNKMMSMTPKQRSQRMREVRAARKAPGYFATLSKEELSAISKRGGLGKKRENPQEEEPQATS